MTETATRNDRMTAWDKLVASSRQGSIFASSWWLDAVAPNAWDVTLIGPADKPTAGWPTVRSSSRFGTVHTGARLTPYLGPILREPSTAYRRYTDQVALVEELVAEMGDIAHIEARCHPAFEYWTALKWHDFSQTTSYSWRLDDMAAEDEVLAGIRGGTRRAITKAADQLTVEDGSLEDFLAVQRSTHERKGVDSGAGHEALVRRIDAAASQRDARTIVIVRDSDGEVHAGCYLVHDAHTTYYLMGGVNEQRRGDGGAGLAVWEGIRRSIAADRDFDFEGSMLPGVERFFRTFGGRPVPVSTVRATPSKGYRSATAAKRAGKRITRR